MSLFIEHLSKRYIADTSWNRTAVLQRLKERYPVSEIICPAKNNEVPDNSSAQVLPLNLRDKGLFDQYMAKVQRIEPILQVLRENTLGKSYIKYIENYGERVKKLSAKIQDFDEETTEAVVDAVLGLVKKCLINFIIGAYRGMNGNQEGSEFFGRLHKAIEAYLGQIHVNVQPIARGRSIRETEVVNGDREFELIEMFRILKKEAPEERLVNLIDEIELQPHVVTYVNEDDEIDVAILEGQCVAWGRAN